MDTDYAIEIASSDSDFSDISSDTEHDKAHVLEQLDKILSQRLHTPITAAATSLPTLDPTLTKKQRQRLKKKQAKEDVEVTLHSSSFRLISRPDNAENTSIIRFKSPELVCKGKGRCLDVDDESAEEIAERRRRIAETAVDFDWLIKTSAPQHWDTDFSASKLTHKTLRKSERHRFMKHIPPIAVLKTARLYKRPEAKASLHPYPDRSKKRLEDRVMKRRFLPRLNARKRPSKRRRMHEREGTAKAQRA